MSLGAFLEILRANSHIATAVVFFPVLKRVNEASPRLRRVADDRVR